MGFLRDQEVKLAMRILAWQFQRMNRPLPPAEQLQEMSAKIVDDAHRIAKQRGSNVMTIVRELIAQWGAGGKDDREIR